MALNVTITTQAPGGVAAPGDSDWSVTDDGSVNGDMLKIDILNAKTPEPGYGLEYYEVSIEDVNGSGETRVERLFFGPNVNKTRYIKATTGESLQRVKVRSVEKLKNMFEAGDFTGGSPSGGESVAQSTTSSSADVVELFSANWLIMENINGSFAAIEDIEEPITIDGNAATQKSILQPTQVLARQVTLKSEWSNPVDITPVAGPATVTITANKTTCLQGETVLLTATTSGFQLDGPVFSPMHELHFHWTVDKAGEQGGYTSLTGTNFEDEFGSGQNNRAEGFSRTWAFAPKTTGTVDVDITVRDRSGNVDTDTLTLTVNAAVDEFSDSDIYVLSDTSRLPPGTTSPNFYSDMATLGAAIPLTGEALILIDTTGPYGTSIGDFISMTNAAPDRMVIMQYDDTGVGPAATSRASVNFAMRSHANTVIVSGLNMAGPYDQANPFSITVDQATALELSGASTFVAVSDCKITGFDVGLKPGDSGADYAVHDLEITDYFDYALQHGEPGDHAISGGFLYHNPQAWQRGGKSVDDDTEENGFFVDHTNYRASRAQGSRSFSKCFFMSVAGHSTPSQPAARWWGGANDYPYELHATELMLEQRGSQDFGTTSAAADNFDAPQDVCIDKFVIINTDQPAQCITVSVAPFTLRNARFVYPNMDGNLGGAGGETFIKFAKAGASGPIQYEDTHAQPVVLENITAVSLIADGAANTRGDSDFYLIADDSPFADITTRNILHYAPNLTNSSAESTASLEAGSGLSTTTRYTPLIEDVRVWDEDGAVAAGNTTGPDKLAWNLANSVSTAARSQPSQTATYQPQAGSSAYKDATGSVPYDDIMSTVRGSPTSRGAYD